MVIIFIFCLIASVFSFRLTDYKYSTRKIQDQSILSSCVSNKWMSCCTVNGSTFPYEITLGSRTLSTNMYRKVNLPKKKFVIVTTLGGNIVSFADIENLQNKLIEYSDVIENSTLKVYSELVGIIRHMGLCENLIGHIMAGDVPEKLCMNLKKLKPDILDSELKEPYENLLSSLSAPVVAAYEATLYTVVAGVPNRMQQEYMAQKDFPFKKIGANFYFEGILIPQQFQKNIANGIETVCVLEVVYNQRLIYACLSQNDSSAIE
eukprot:GDKJ01042235.1.p1 GENE.GDKJ01042235.1~~GDKJ01042235.1.p1  ORF type:complete len:263 (-),score=39.92 GDKJ01042235.1:358-1146(-)